MCEIGQPQNSVPVCYFTLVWFYVDVHLQWVVNVGAKVFTDGYLADKS